MLAVHDSLSSNSPLASRLSSLGHSGEHFDAKAQQQYLRARFYNPANGRFNRLDPFAGNMQDPQSLHKYAYVHGDPIGGMDPTGLANLGSVSTANGISTTMKGSSGTGITAAGAYANTAIRVWQATQTIADVIHGYYTGGTMGAVNALVGLDLDEIKQSVNDLKQKGITPQNLGTYLVSNAASSAGPVVLKLDVPKRGKLGRVLKGVTKIVGKSNGTQEFVGELAAVLIMQSLLFDNADLPHFPSVKGPDFFMKQYTNVWAMVEAKGGSSKLSKGARYGDQMEYDWIKYWYHWLAKKNQRYTVSDGPELQSYYGNVRGRVARHNPPPILAVVARLNLALRKDQLKIGFQAWTNGSTRMEWRGF